MSFSGDLYGSFADEVITTKGDLRRGNASGTPERYGIGSANQVLSVSSGQMLWKTLTTADSVLTTQGDVLYENGSGLARLGAGSAGELLQSGGTGANVSWVSASPIGTQDLFIPCASMWTQGTNGATLLGTKDFGEDKPSYTVAEFSDSTEQHCQFSITMPRNFDNGTVTAQFFWTGTGGSGDVVWSMAGLAVSDNDSIDASFGTEQTVTDTYHANDDLMVSSATSAITIGGTPADSDTIWFQISRNTADGSDDYSDTAKLIGVVITYTIDAATSS